ncbi:MAG: Branched-chain-amino-acid aminotransferase [Dehalococcoidia bacterium]|nr:Branched-chain-amino-acid aminotransferase [Chloroflexota bacterium]
MKELNKIWLDGEFVNWQSSKIHILNHSLHYGSAVFEGIRAYKTKKGSAIFRLPEHIDRLFYSASCMGMKIPFSKEEIREAILKLVKINKEDKCYIRPLVFFGYGKMGLNPKGALVKTAIINWPWGAYLGEGKPIRTVISKYTRPHPKSTIMNAKISGTYSNSILASLEAQKAKVEEAILLDFQGFIAEGPGENIFMVKNRKIFTPPKGTILPGITRDSVIKIAKNYKISVEEKKITSQEIKTADEVFFTGTAVEICPIGKIDKTIINKGEIGEITKKIKNTYQKIVCGEEKKYLEWLTFV